MIWLAILAARGTLETAQLAVERNPLLFGYWADLAEFDQVGIDDLDITAARFGLPAASIAAKAAPTEKPAGRTLTEWISMFGCCRLARFVRRVNGSLIGFQRPVDMIIRAAMAMHAAAMVEDDDVGLAWGGS